MLQSRSAVTKTQAIIIAVIIVVAAVVGAIYYLMLPTPTTPAPEYIKIGFPQPITGAYADAGQASLWVAQKIEDYVNNVMGGVYLSEYGKKIPIKIIIRDTKSDSDFAATVAAELITVEKVDLMIAAQFPPTVIPVTTQCERYGVPCIAFQCPLLAWLKGGPYEWSFHAFWAEVDVAGIYVGMWDKVKDKTNMRVAGLWFDDASGRTQREALIKTASAKGYTVIDSGLAPAGTADFSAYIQQWKAQGAEILVGTWSPPDFASLWRQCHELGFIPKVCSITRALLYPSSLEALGGDLGVGLTTEVWWSPEWPYKCSITGKTAAEICGDWTKETGKPWIQPLGYSWAPFEVAIDALKRAGSLDKTKIRDAIAETNITTIVGPINYKKPLTTEQQNRYKDFPEFFEFKDHYSITPVVGGQWLREKDGSWKLQIVYNWIYPEIPETGTITLIRD